MEKVTKEKQLKVITENRVGMLSEVTGLMADKGVNIEHICAYATGDKAIFCLLTNDYEKARNALKAKGYHIEETEVILLRLWNRPGSLAAVTAKLRQHGINLESVYGTSSQGKETMTVVFSSEDNDRAADVFTTMVIDEG